MVISKLPRGATEKEEPAVMVTIYGAALETITSDGREVCTTDANGEGVASLNTGQTYTLVGGVSGYEKTVTVQSYTESIKVMPERALYWYGNECNMNYKTNNAKIVKSTNCVEITSINKGISSCIYTSIGDISKYTKLHSISSAPISVNNNGAVTIIAVSGSIGPSSWWSIINNNHNPNSDIEHIQSSFKTTDDCDIAIGTGGIVGITARHYACWLE